MQLHQISGRWRLGLGLSLVTVLLWGLLPIALAVTLQALDVFTVTWFRFLVSFGLLAMYLLARQQLPVSKPDAKSTLALPFRLKRREIGLLMIATLLLGSNYLFFLQGLAQTSPASSEVLIQLAPVLLGLGALVLFKERYTLRQWLGLGVLAFGLTLFFHEQLRTLVNAPTPYIIGSGLIVLGSITWATYALVQKQLLQRFPSSSIMLTIYGGCALMFSPFAAPQQLLHLSPLHWGMLIFCSLNTVFAYGAFAESLDHWEASKISAIQALTPLVTFASVWAVAAWLPTLVAPERITVLGLFGAVLVVVGSIAIALGQRNKEEQLHA